MTTYFTKEPLGSTSPYVLFDNAQNFDYALNDITQAIWKDRFGRNRKTYWGWEQESAAQLLNQQQRFNTFIQSSGYKVIGEYTAGPLTITEYNQLIRYQDAFWKLTVATDIPFTTTGNDAASWASDSAHFVSVGDGVLRQELASPGGAGLVGDIAKPVTWSGFSGGADPTGVASSDAAFLAAGAYIGEVRAEGNFKLDNPVNRVNSVIELPPGSTITKNKLSGPSTANGSNIPSKTLFGRLVIRDEDTTPIGSDSFAEYPDMGQALRLDSKQVQGQCGMYLGGDRRSPIIGQTAYVGFHTRHDQSVATPKLWGMNPVVIKNVRATDLPAGVSSETIGMEISISNNTDERGQPLGAGALQGLFISYINTQNEASSAISTGGLTAGYRTALWLDGVTPQGTHISLRDEVSANSGVRCGIDTTAVNQFTDSAMLLGRGHSIASLDTTGTIRPMMYINSANEMVHGASLAHRFIGSISVFDHSIRPGADNTYDYGSASFRGRTAYFGTGSINTSDERHKPIRENISDDLLDAWGEVSWATMFKFDDAIAEKGADGARWHFGLIAQHVRDVLTKHGIDGFTLGLLCYDEWSDQFVDEQVNVGEITVKTKTVTVKKFTKTTVKESAIVRSESGELVLVEVDAIKEEPVGSLEYVKDQYGNFVLNDDGEKLTVFIQETEEVEKEYEAPADPVYEKKLVKAAGNRYGIRYEEALSLEAALQRRNYERLLKQHNDLTARISKLEGR